MTGRELIIYILENHLEDENVFENGHFKFLMDINEAASRFNVGPETVKLWYIIGSVSGITIGKNLYFPRNMKDPREKGSDK